MATLSISALNDNEVDDADIDAMLAEDSSEATETPGATSGGTEREASDTGEELEEPLLEH